MKSHSFWRIRSSIRFWARVEGSWDTPAEVLRLRGNQILAIGVINAVDGFAARLFTLVSQLDTRYRAHSDVTRKILESLEQQLDRCKVYVVSIAPVP